MLFTQLLMFYLGHWYGDIVRLRTIHNDFDLWVIECAPMPSSWPVVSCNVQLSIAVQTRKNPSILLPVVVGSDDDYCARAARLVVTKQRFKGGNKRRVDDKYDRKNLNEFQRFSRSVCVLGRTGRPILTRRHPLFAAPSPIQLLTKLVQDTTQHTPPLGILTPLCAVRSTLHLQ